MSRVCFCLALLILVLTFNAYACVLPLQTADAMDCSTSDTQEPIRQICDAFLELGPHSESSSGLIFQIASFDFGTAVELTLPTLTVAVVPQPPPHSTNTPVHLSIQSTVLRI